MEIKILKSIVLTLILGAAFLVFGPAGIYHSQPFSVDKIFVLEPGQSIKRIAHNLEKENLIPHSYVFFIAGFLNGTLNKLKPGEYLIPAHASPEQLSHILSSGKGIVRKLTIPEGLTVYEICQLVKALPLLKGEITTCPTEGLLLPETYIYTYGDTRQSLINRMEIAMKKTLDSLLQSQSPPIPLTTKEHVLTLASVIEKETAVPFERSRVAAVFINRLKQGMPLQSDPTVIYGLTRGQEKLGRPLSRVDLSIKTDFNTYINTGLPPHPIACPGQEALKAALSPGDFDDVYFVADGTGGHAFSKSLEAHNNNVRQWRRIQKERKQ